MKPNRKSLPPFLLPFEKSLVRYKKECLKINAKPIDIAPMKDPLRLEESKFLGLPFLPKNKDYPKDKEGDFMLMIAQLNFAEMPALPNFPQTGILQLYLSSQEWYGEEYKIIHLKAEELKEAPIIDFSFLPKDHFEETPIGAIHKLEFLKVIENGGLEDASFDFLFNNLNWLDYEETLSKTDQQLFEDYFDAAGHKIGGYAEFTQADPRDYSPHKKEDIQILQIDADKNIMFGDTGVAHLFIDKNDLLNNDLEKAYFYWDCC